MTNKDRIKATFLFQQTEKVPYWINIEDELTEKLDLYFGHDAWKKDLIPYFYGGHFIGSEFNFNEDLGNGIFRDRFGTVYKLGNITHVEKPPLEYPSLEGYRWPDVEELIDIKKWKKLYEEHSESYRILGMSYGFFERASRLRGFENILMDMIDSPEFVEELMEAYLNLKLKCYQYVSEYIPFEGFFDGGDDCDQRGCIFGVNHWRRFIKPHLKTTVDFCHDLGKPAIVHMCGNVLPLVDDLLDIKLDVLESLQPEAIDLFQLKQKVDGKMALIGGLGVQSTLPFGTPEEVKSKINWLIDVLGKGGGYVFAPAKAIMKDVPVENAVAVFEALWDEKGPF